MDLTEEHGTRAMADHGCGNKHFRYHERSILGMTEAHSTTGACVCRRLEATRTSWLGQRTVVVSIITSNHIISGGV